MSNAVTSLSDFHKRVEIEAKFNRTVADWQVQCDLAIRLARAEFRMKCHLARALYEAELRELDRDRGK